MKIVKYFFLPFVVLLDYTMWNFFFSRENTIKKVTLKESWKECKKAANL